MKTGLIAAVLMLLLATPARAEDLHLQAGGREREYRLHWPEAEGASAARPLPLVIVLHGGLGSGEQAEESYGWNAAADTNGFLVAYPDGVRRTWNAGGGCCGPAWRDQIDDVGFLDALIVTLIDQGGADPARIYLAGISNGGAMAYRYACEGAHAVAAIGSVSGAMTADCARPRPVSAIEIHGLQDERIPFEGGRGEGLVTLDWPSAMQGLETLRAANGCGAPAAAIEGTVETTLWRCADGRLVELIAIADAGHQWPGGRPHRGLGARLIGLDTPSRALDATQTLWDFFAAQPPR